MLLQCFLASVLFAGYYQFAFNKLYNKLLLTTITAESPAAIVVQMPSLVPRMKSGHSGFCSRKYKTTSAHSDLRQAYLLPVSYSEFKSLHRHVANGMIYNSCGLKPKVAAASHHQLLQHGLAAVAVQAAVTTVA